MSLFDATYRAAAKQRLHKLTPETKPRFGTMTPAVFLAHLIDSFEVSFGEREVTIMKSPFNNFLGRWFLLNGPWPRGKVKAPADFHHTKPATWDDDLAKVLAYMDRFEAGPDQHWGVSPLVGHLTGKQWGKLNTKHLEHHFAQFGI